MRTSIPFNNFSSGQIDRKLKARYDIGIYQTGHEISRNFCQTMRGNSFYRTGFELVEEIGFASALYEFKFNQSQSYLLIFDNSFVYFWTYDNDGNFVRVLTDTGEEYKLAHPFGNKVDNLCMAQNCDVLYITHINGEIAEHQLIRKKANEFEFKKTAFTNSGTASLSDDPTKNHGCPCTCAFYESRLFRMSSTKKFTYLYGSKGASYDNITVGENTNDGLQFDIAEANSKANWIIGGANSLLVGTPEGILTINGGSTEKAITPTDISAKLSCSDGVGETKAIRKDNFVFFVSANGRRLYMFEFDVLLEQFKATNLSKANYEITKGGITKLVYKKDQFDNMFALCDGKLLQICFSNDENVNAWSEWNTDGKILDICTITRPDGDSDLFIKVQRKINNSNRYYLEKLSEVVEFPRFEDYVSDVTDFTDREKLYTKKQDEERFNRLVAEKLRECNYLDSSVKYDGLKQFGIVFNATTKRMLADQDVFTNSDVGRRISYKAVTGYEYGIFDITRVINAREVEVKVILEPTSNFSSNWYLSATVFSGLDHLEGKYVSVVGNGGYIGNFKVVNGQIDITNADVNKVGTAVIGLKYNGLLKSMNMGMMLQGNETYTSPKNIYSIVLYLSFSAGGKVGNSLYELEEVQDFNPDGFYDLPPLPIDSEKEILVSGEYLKEKNYFIVQDKPLPFEIAMVVPKTKHVVVN